MLVAFFYFAWHDFIYFNNGAGQYLLNLSTIELWMTGDHPLWYASFIIIMYAIYPTLYKWDEKTKHLSTILLIIAWVLFTAYMWHNQWPLYTNVERAVSRFPIFLLGMIAAPHVFSEKGIVIKPCFWGLSCAMVVVLLLLITIVSMPAFIRRYIMGVIAVGIIIVWATLRNNGYLKFLSKPLLFVGAMTYETYIMHVIVKEVVDLNDLWTSLSVWAWYVVIIGLTIPLAWLLTKISEKIRLKA